MDDLFCVGDKEFYHHVVSAIQKDYHIGSEDTNDVLFVGQRVCWENSVLEVLYPSGSGKSY